jgi:hypothetical protein
MISDSWTGKDLEGSDDGLTEDSGHGIQYRLRNTFLVDRFNAAGQSNH